MTDLEHFIKWAACLLFVVVYSFLPFLINMFVKLANASAYVPLSFILGVVYVGLSISLSFFLKQHLR